VTLWEIDIYPAAGEVDRGAQRIQAEAEDLGLATALELSTAHGYLIQGNVPADRLDRVARQVLADEIVERAVVGRIGDHVLEQSPGRGTQPVHVLLKPGVMDPVALTAQQTLTDLGLPVEAVRTFRKYWLPPLSDAVLSTLCGKVLANDSIEQIVVGPLRLERLELGAPYQFQLVTVPIRELDDDALLRLSREGQLYLSLAEMQTIQRHFQQLQRDPTDVELETVAQTWSEHCSHKTLAGRIAYRDDRGERHFENMLKETIFAATQHIRRQLGSEDWCVSVFKDNAGVICFDDEYNVVFKVETHNHPSALEPYGGANTGIGGVIRDPLGTGKGAKPICNTDVFCFAPPDTPHQDLPQGVLHPRRVMKGVVSGVRDYGNRMGIPTVNGAVYFDPRYLGNPLVYCGNVGLLPRDKSFKEPLEGDWIVVIGGRTGRDGIHGATFSSAELTSESESVSGGAVQIGNAITEKMVLDVLLAARDRNLYNAVTDCGAGGFSSAVGEMGAEIGAEVWLDRAPLKYEGLSYTEIWISEAQERMVLSVPPQKWDVFHALCAAEGVEATILGTFVPTGRLQLKYHDRVVGDLEMSFIHDGRPPVIREAQYQRPAPRAMEFSGAALSDHAATLHRILASGNVASKEWVIRQYDHEVQGGSAVKPLVGVANDGPGDASVVRPRFESYRGLAVSCGMNPHYGDHDTYDMAASAIDEAVRNCVAVGADPSRIAILDNFCWGYTDRPETLGSLVRAALACHDVAVALGTPFISGKDSLNNEFSYEADGRRQTISIPPTLLISALGLVPDVRRCVTMDAKENGNLVYLLGTTRCELGGSHFALVHKLQGGQVPQVDAARARSLFAVLHRAISQGTIRACHDLSEGGLAVAAAEMAFAGGLGMELDLAPLNIEGGDRLDAEQRAATALFSESNTRFLCEVSPQRDAEFRQILADAPLVYLGRVTNDSQLQIRSGTTGLLRESIAALKESWQAPLRWR
jgi:phosphoribosylformylglycinamidine synthase subunit PurSL